MGPLTRHAAACAVLALVLLSGLAPLAGALYIGPRVKVDIADNALNAGDATLVVVTIFDENGTRVAGATVSAVAEVGSFVEPSKTTNAAGSVNFIYQSPFENAPARSVVLTFTAVYGTPPYTEGKGTVWLSPRPSATITGPAQVLRGGAAVRYDLLVESGGQPASGAAVVVDAPAMGTIGATGGATDASGKSWFNYVPPPDRTGAVTLNVNATPPGGEAIQGMLAIEVVAEVLTLDVSVLSDRASLHCWGSCNVTATVTRGGSPMMGATVAWTASRGWLPAASSSTDMLGKSRVTYTAMGASAAMWAGEALVNATATYQSAMAHGQAAIDVMGLEVGWSADLSYRANAGQLYPGEKLTVEVDLDLPAGRPWEFITPLKVVLELRDVGGTVVDTLALGQDISLRPGLHWTSGPRDVLTIPPSPTVPSYTWQVRVLSGNGLWVHHELPAPVRVTVLTQGATDWTFMVFYNGDSNLAGEVWTSIRKLEREAPAGEFDVLLQTDTTTSGTKRYELAHDGDPAAVDSPVVWEGPEVDSGDPATLLDFMLWATDRAPAGHYCLVVWDHGGAYRGSSFDHASEECIDNSELASALGAFSAARRRLDVIAFDACLMSSVEVARRLQGVAGLLVGSETVVAGDLFVPEVLSILLDYYPSSRPTAAQVATAIVRGRAELGAHFPYTAIDLSAAATALAALDAMGTELLDEWTALEDEFAMCAQAARRVVGPYGNTAWLVDASLFLQRLQDAIEGAPMSWRYPDQIEAVETAREALSAAIIDRIQPSTTGPHGDLTGVNLFIPRTADAYSRERGYYLANGLDRGHGWTRLLDALYYETPDGFNVVPPVDGFQSAVLGEAGATGEDDDGDGGFETLEGSMDLDNSANSGPAIGFVDIVVYGGLKAGSPEGLVARKSFTVAAGARSTPSFAMTCPVDDLVDAVATVVAPDGTVLAQAYLGTFLMNATPVAGSPPSLAVAASATEVVEGDAVSLTATASDPDGDTVTVWWDLDASDGVALDATGPTASASYRGAGNRTVVCIASGGTLLTVRLVNITVSLDAANRPPVANLTAEVLDTGHPMRVTVDASGSTDPDTDALEFAFDLGDGNWTGWSSRAVLVHDYATDGTYDVIVRVRDRTEAGAAAVSVAARVPWTPPNRAPLAALSMSAASVRTGVQLTADAASSSDPDGDALEFMFDWGDGAASQWGPSPSTAHSYAAAGNWTVTVSVRDPLGLLASATRAVEVTAPPPNARPTAVLALTLTTIEAGKSLIANGSGSSDPDAGDTIEARVDWGDGNVTAWAALADLSHAYPSPGTYTVTLEVRDRLGLTASAESAVTVTPVPDTKKKKDRGFIPGAGAAGALAAIVLVGMLTLHLDRRARPPSSRSARVDPMVLN